MTFRWLGVFLMMVVWLSACAGSDYKAQSYSAAPAQSEPRLYGGVVASEAQVLAAKPGSTVSFSGTKRKVQANAPVRRKYIRRANLRLEVDDEDDFQPTLNKAKKIAKAVDGLVQQEGTRSLTLLVPTEQLNPVLKKIEALGEVKYRNISIVDVTAKYVDLQIRIKNLRKMRKRLTDLVAQSTDVSEILKIERELNRVTTELERLEGRMRLLRKDTTYATIYLSLEEEITPGPLGWVFYGLAVGVKWLFVWD